MSMIHIDGSQGEGGGQILRSSLALSLVTGQPFRIDRIRAGRSKPGLLRQHLTAVNAAVAISDGAADGKEIGSLELVFRPGNISGGDYRFAVGTAGSATLVLQTVLPALMLAQKESTLVLEGGTHNPFAPPFDFLARTFLPILERFGPRVAVSLTRPGFYPAGGGRMEVRITPVPKLCQMELLERGERLGQRVTAHLGALPRQIAERAFDRVRNRMSWEPECFEIVEYRNLQGPGFALTIDILSQNLTEVFVGFGEKHLRSEQVSDLAVDQARHYLAAQAPVGEYLADQLLLPLAIAGGGVFVTTGLSRHSLTNIEVVQCFLGGQFKTEMENNACRVSWNRS